MASNDNTAVEQSIINPTISLPDNFQNIFALEGLSGLLNVIPFSNLKTLRLVCCSWNEIISLYKRFYNCQVTFNRNWVTQIRGDLSFNIIHPWKRLTLHGLPLHRNTMFYKYWPLQAPTIKILSMESIAVDCSTLCNLINTCTTVQYVKFFKINFDSTLVFQPEVQQQTAAEIIAQDNDIRARWRRISESQRVYCSHVGFDGVVSPRTIKNLEISKTESFPLCILDLLEKRCEGVLESFTFNHNTEGGIKTNPPVVYPAITQFQEFFIRICEKSSRTLKSFSWLMNMKNGNLMEGLTIGEGIQFDRISLAMQGCLRRQWGIPTITTHIDFLQTQTQVVELTLGILTSPPTLAQLATVIPTLVSLQKLKLQINFAVQANWNAAEDRSDLSFLEGCQSLEDLTVVDKTTNILNEHDWLLRGDGIQLNYMVRMPFSIRKWTIFHRMRDMGIIRQAIAHPNLHSLTKLYIMDGTMIGNELFHLIVNNLEGLEELTLRNSKVLTDSGLTGYSEKICRRLLDCHKEGLLMKEPITEPNHIVGPSISKLVHLRELDLSKCFKLTDISVCYALQFQHLKTLKLNGIFPVSDVGLIFLGRQNPKLQCLELKGNGNVTYGGLCNLIRMHKSICHIYLSEPSPNPESKGEGDAAKKKKPSADQPKFPLFDEIIHFIKSKIPRPGNVFDVDI